ncbi:hypothetical protein [Desulfovulcanus sp.]
MCGVCHENIVFSYFLKDEINNNIDYKKIIIYTNYAQETLLLKELLLYIQASRDKSDIMMILPTYCVRVIEDIFLQKQVDYFLFDKEILSSYFSELQPRFESFQKKISWLRFWKPLYEKESFSNLKILESFFSSSEMKNYAENALNYYLQRFTGKPEIEEPHDYGVAYEEGEEPEDVKRYREYYGTLNDELYFLYPVFHCALIYLAEVKRDVNMLEKIAYCNPICILDFYGLDLWLRRKAIFYLIDIKGIEAIPELLNNGCEVKYAYFYCIKNEPMKEKIDQLIRENMSRNIVQEWIYLTDEDD